MSASPLIADGCVLARGPQRLAQRLAQRLTLCLTLCLAVSASLIACDPTADVQEAEGGAAGAAVALTDTKADLPLSDPWSEAGAEASDERRGARLISLYEDFISHDLSIGQESSPWDLTGCLVCGRETGFLPTPTLTLSGAEALDGKDTSYVSLSWDPIEGATEYRVVIVQVSGGEVVDVIDVSVTNTTLGVGLELGFEYFIYVVAEDTTHKRRSEPSAPLLLSCLEGDVCASLDALSAAP